MNESQSEKGRSKGLQIVPLGGMGHVTQNMFLYIYDDEILVVDCGIGFPDSYMPGVDLLIPDVSYLLELIDKGKKIVGMILSHGHDDHIAATPYILPHLPDFPIFASELTAGFAEKRMKDGKVDKTVTAVKGTKEFSLGNHFSAQLVPVTHSVPDTRHIVLHTPEGIIYHGSDYKIDANPVDGMLTDFDFIRGLRDKKVLCMMVDCLRVEYEQRVKSESTTGPVIERVMTGVQGKCVVTLMSSHIHRIQQTVNAAEKLGRKVVFIGRSVEQNVEVATQLKKLHIPEGLRVDKRDIEQVPARELCLIVAGSQGQEGSSLMRAVYGDHPIVQITQQDRVIFSADAIPGNELNYFGAIDELSRNGVEVVYPTIEPDIHQSGHASTPEQIELIEAVQPEYLMPIGGQDRHRSLFKTRIADKLGFDAKHLLLPQDGEVMQFADRHYSVVDHLALRPQVVDGLGVGDVGPVVLSDRRTLGQAGIIVLVIPREQSGKAGKSKKSKSGKKKGNRTGSSNYDVRSMTVISRGFVFMKEADEVIDFIHQTVGDIIHKERGMKEADLLKIIERRLSRKLYKVIKREPMIVAVVV